MTYFDHRGPVLRMSDVEELIRETAMDDSDGQHVMEYIKRKRRGGRIRPFDGSDNPINFRLDHLQPVPASQPNPSIARDTLAIIRSPEAASRRSIGLVQPPSPVQSAENRIASFVSPARSTAPKLVAHSPRLATNSSMRQNINLNPHVGLTRVMGSNAKNIQKDLLLRQCIRANKVKCELIRSANNPTSSTPITGESTTRNSENFLNLRETISPIADDELDTTPHRPFLSPNAGSRVLTPVPATQHPPLPSSGIANNECHRENTPPRDADHENLVIPETPSPVRRSPRNASTPLSALSAANRTVAKDLTFRNEASGAAELQGLLKPENAPVLTPTRRSILKNRDSSLGSPKNRVSFSERLTSVREITPRRDMPSNNFTSDESDEEGAAISVRPNHLSISDKQDKRIENHDVKQSRPKLKKSRITKALDEPDKADEADANRPSIPQSDVQKEQALQTHSKAKDSNRTNVNAVNMIMDDWDDRSEESIGTNKPNDQEVVDEIAERTINSPVQITTIDTPRSVLMDILEPPSAFGDDNSDDEPESEPSERTSVIDSSRDRNILEPPHESMAEHNTERRCNVSRQSNGRFMSATSPHDHVPLELIHVTDMIHSKVNSERVEPKESVEKRTTIVLPRRSKPKPDEDTEQYFATIEKTCSGSKATHRERKQFRKLFSQEISEKEPPERDTSPQPLPDTQETSVEPPPVLIKPMYIAVNPLSSMTLQRYTLPVKTITDRSEQLVVGENNGSDAIEPILEKQNMERSEKVNLSKDNDDGSGDARKPSGIKSKNRREKESSDKQNVGKKSAKSKKAQPSPQTADNGMVQKYLKNVSNEIRQHIDSEADGLRRSHRNKRVATGVINASVGIPMYQMPSINAVLSYRKKRLDHTSQMAAKNARTKERKKRGNENERNVEEQQRSDERDADGFRIPSMVSKKTKGKQSSRTKDALTMMSSAGRVGSSDSDSGISTGVPTNDDAEEDNHLLPSKRPKQTPKQATESTDALPSSSSSSDPPVPDVDLVTEKRQAFDWMRLLMNDRQSRPEALPLMDVHEFAHFSLQHLFFEQRDEIEYSFYVQSNGETCGFMRFQPHAEKRTSRTRNHLLKFLILNGSLKFTINKKEVNVVEGDFLILPANSTYRTINGSETTLLFMMKSSVPKR
uniref:Mif2/CENP-C cupin domain-containing protein n=1 Tax=Anopheles farauti TaxID=69004 RepID=A0A182QWV0_9DIPT